MPLAKRTLDDIQALLRAARVDSGAKRADINALERVEKILRSQFYGITQQQANAIAARCRGQTAALDAIADRNNNIVPVSMAARAIIEAGLSRSTQVSLTASLWNRFRVGKRWEYFGPGEYCRLAIPAAGDADEEDGDADSDNGDSAAGSEIEGRAQPFLL